MPLPRSTLTGLAWISPWIIGVILFLLVPIALSFYYSLTDYSLLEPPVFIGTANYRELAADSLFWTAARNTLTFALASVVLGTFLSITLAIALDRTARGSTFFRAVIFLPTLVPIVTAALAWMWLYNPEHGLINRLLRPWGITDHNWLGDSGTALAALIFMSLWTIGSAVVIYAAALRNVPASLYEAADLDGVGHFSRTLHITLPMISPTILFNVVVSIIWALQVFGAPQVMTKGGPENATRVVMMEVYASAFVYGRMGYASAIAWLQIISAIALAGLTLFLSRRFVHHRST